MNGWISIADVAFLFFFLDCGFVSELDKLVLSWRFRPIFHVRVILLAFFLLKKAVVGSFASLLEVKAWTFLLSRGHRHRFRQSKCGFGCFSVSLAQAETVASRLDTLNANKLSRLQTLGLSAQY